MSVFWKEIEGDVARRRADIIEQMVGFVDTDVLLFWSVEADLYREQERVWLPILKRFGEELGLGFNQTQSLEVSSENSCLHPVLKKCLESLDDRQISALIVASSSMRSVLLGLALVLGWLTADSAFEASELEELYQNQRWGTDPEAEERRTAIRDHLREVETYLRS